jgi:hypothetical protein
MGDGLTSSVTSIGAGAFSGCTNLTGITIPKSVTSIGANAFYGCNNLEIRWYYNPALSIDILRPHLELVIIPNGVTSIRDSAFENCSRLADVRISADVTSIGDRAFYGCSLLTSVMFSGYRDTNTIGVDAFIDTANTTSLRTAYAVEGIYTRVDTTSTTWKWVRYP